MDAITLLQADLQTAHDYIEGTMSDVTEEQAHWMPPGTANPLGATYAHAVASEDLIINGLFQGKAPLFATSWAGKTGMSEPMPTPNQNWEDYGPWARRVRVDLPALREYARAVYGNTADYLASLTPDGLDRPLDLNSVGLGTQTLGWGWNRLIVGHVDNLCGEISCLKGLQGSRGYPG